MQTNCVEPPPSPPAPPAPPPPPAAWQAAASLTTARLGHGVAALDGVVYAIGGRGAAGVLQSCEKFDPKVGYWSPDVPDLPPLPGKSPGRYFLVAVEVKGFLWAIGGSNGVGATGAVSIYDGGPSWQNIPPLPEERIYHGAGTIVDPVLRNASVVVVGGKVGPGNGPAWTATTTVFDQSRFQWQQRADMVVPRQLPAVGVVGETTLFVAGGFNGAKGVLDSVEAYDFLHDAWRVVGALPKGVVASAVGVVVTAGGAPLLLTAGGLDVYGATLGDPVAAVSESSDGGAAWAAGPPLAQARTYHGVAVVGNGTAAGGPRRLFAVGGSRLGDASNATGALASVEVFVV